MKTVYINLDRDTEKNSYMKNLFPKAERIAAVDGDIETERSISPFIASAEWRDPYHNRRLTSGEVGCFLSHYNVWKKCIQENQPFLVLEDDVQIIDKDYLHTIQSTLAVFPEKDLIYVSSKPLSSFRTEISKKLETAGYCYWTSAYCITPVGAEKLIRAAESSYEIIPVDEFIPACIGSHSQKELNDKYSFVSLDAIRYKDSLLYPKEGAFNNSTTEYSPIWGSLKIHITTVATDTNKAQYLFNTSEAPVKNLGEGVEWKGGSMKGPGGGQKINLLKEFLNSDIDENDIVLFLDGYDTCIFSPIQSIVERYLQFKKEVIFAAEKICWPDTTIQDQFPIPDNGYRYLNSGCIIGTVRELRKITSLEIQDFEDDQLYYQKRFLSNEFNIGLDHESYLFCCMSGSKDYIEYNGVELINRETMCTSLVLHGNGGEDTKNAFINLCSKLKSNSRYKIPELDPSKIRYLDRDIIVIDDFLPEQFCRDLIAEGEKKGGWNPLERDAYPAQEIRLRDLADREFLNTFYYLYKERVIPLVEKHWAPMRMYDIRDLFIIKYDMEGQRNLPLHHDMSLVTGSLKLNDDYEGAELVFPRQGITNKDIPVGSLILWPSSVTHPHKCEDLISGTKYSLTMWTGRDAEDKEPL